MRHITYCSAMSSDRPTTSSRTSADLRGALERWLADRLVDPQVTDAERPPTNGMSSETLLFDVTHTRDGERVIDHCVARIPPDPADEPVFPDYDMGLQAAAMRLVGERTSAPVPEILWYEPDVAPLGAPFFVMRKASGVVPPDVLPYTMGGNWLFDASPDEQRRAQDAAVGVLAQIHTIDGPTAAAAGLALPGEGSALRRHVDNQYRYYEWVTSDGIRSPLIEEALAWLEDRWPEETAEVLSWGDSRVGNMLFEDFAPTAVLDWEMVATGPRELDLGWLVYLHRFFQDLATGYGLPGLPDFLEREAAAQHYRELTGHTPVDLKWYMVYAALRHATIMFRITRRSVRFGEREMPENPDHAIAHHATVRAMLDGTYF